MGITARIRLGCKSPFLSKNQPLCVCKNISFELVDFAAFGPNKHSFMNLIMSKQKVNFLLILLSVTLSIEKVNSQVENLSGHDSTIFISHTVFVPHIPYESGMENWGVAVADFDKDGDVDIVTCSSLDSKITVHMNDGKGRFENKKSYPGGQTHRDVCVLDADNDGYMDIAAVSIKDMRLSWWLNNGSGGFGERKSVVTGGFPHDVTSADVNQDGNPDLITVTVQTHSVNIHAGDGKGNFAGAQVEATGASPRSVRVGDINGDGIPDIVAGADDRTFNIHFGLGGGKFKPKKYVLSKESLWGLGIADFNGDGRMDVAAASYSVNELCIHLNGGELKGEIQWGHPQYLNSGDKIFDLVTGDFDLDGDLDVVTASTRDEVINVHLNDGKGVFSERSPIKSGNWNAAIAAADFDGDKDLDIATASIKDSRLNIHRNISIEPEQEATQTCVYGTVYDKEKNTPLEGIVSVVGPDGISVGNMKTLADGKYRICGVHFANGYILRAKVQGYPPYDEKFDLPKSVGKEGLKKDVYLEHVKETFVFGVVTDKETGLPIADADLVINDKTGANVVTIKTDAKGKYRKSLPFDSNYELIARKTDYNEKSAGLTLLPGDYPAGVEKNFELFKIKPKTTACVEGFVMDEKTKVKLREADVKILDKSGNVVKSVKTDYDGKYRACVPFGDYDISATKTGYMFKVDTFSLGIEHADKGLQKDMELQKFEVGMSIVLKNIYYDVAKATLRPESVNELNRLLHIMNDNPTLVVEISGHTDSDGSDSYNQQLSQARSQSVVDYLVDAGTATNRMEAKGYGESQPIAANDTPENKQLNRRTEFKVLAF